MTTQFADAVVSLNQRTPLMIRSLLALTCVLATCCSTVIGQSPDGKANAPQADYRLAQPITAEVSPVFTGEMQLFVNDLVLGRNDRELVVAEGNYQQPGVLTVIDLKDRWRGSQFEARLGFSSLASLPLRKELAAACWDSTVRILELPSLKPRVTIPIDHSATRIAASPDGQLLAVVAEGYADQDVSPGRSVSLYDVETGKLKKTLATELFRGFHICFSPSGKEVAVCGGLFQKPSGGIAIWDVETGDQKYDIFFDATLWKCDYFDDGKWLLATGLSGTYSENPKSGKRHARPDIQGRTLQILPDRKTAVVPDQRGNLILVELPELKTLKTIPTEQGFVSGMTLIDRGKKLVTASTSGLRIWDVADWSSESMIDGRHGVGSGTSLVALPGSTLLAAAIGRNLSLFDAASGTLWNSLKMTANIRQLSAHPTQNRLGIVLEGGRVESLDLTTGRVQEAGRLPAETTAALSRDLAATIFVSPDGEVIRRRLDNGSQKSAPVKFAKSVTATVVSGGGAVCCGLSSGEAAVFDSDLGRVRLRVPGAVPGRVACLDWSEAKQRLAVADETGTVSVWGSDAKGQPKLLQREAGKVRTSALAFSSVGDRLAVGLSNGGMLLLSVNDTEQTQRIPPRSVNAIATVVWLNGDRELVASHSDGLLNRIKLQRKPLSAVHSLTADNNLPIHSACLSRNGDTCFLAIGSKVEVRSTKSWDVQQVLAGHRGVVNRIRLSPDGQRLASTGTDSFVQIRKVSGDRWETDQTLFLPGVGYRVEWSPDGRWLLVGLSSPDMLVYDTKSWELAHKFTVPFIPNTFSFSSDGRWLTTAGINLGEPSQPSQIQIWDTSTWKDPKLLTGHTHGIEAVAMTGDGKRFYSTSADSEVLEWTVASGTPRKIRNLPMSGTSLSLLPDPRLAIVSWHFANLGILDLSDGTIVATLDGHPEGQNVLMRDVVVSHDGQWAVSCAVADVGRGVGNVKLWRIGQAGK